MDNEAVEPVALGHVERTEALVWVCGKCRIVAVDEEAARACCAQRKCVACETMLSARSCGNECERCQSARWKAAAARREAVRVERAVKLRPEDWAGEPVFVEDEEYHADLDALRDYYAEPTEGRERPQYAWPCDRKCLQFDARVILEQALQEFADGSDDDGVTDQDIADLQARLDAWAARQKVGTWVERHDRVVVLGPDFWEAEE